MSIILFIVAFLLIVIIIIVIIKRRNGRDDIIRTYDLEGQAESRLKKIGGCCFRWVRKIFGG